MANKKVNAKKEAYAKKQEQEGKKVVNWIFGVLIILALCYAVWSIIMVA